MVADRMRGHGGGGCRGGDVEQLWLAVNHVAPPEAESDDRNQACARKTAVSPSIDIFGKLKYNATFGPKIRGNDPYLGKEKSFRVGSTRKL